jgi:hypothetical protein
MVKTEGCRVEVTQRLKRFITILDKLKREPTLDLSKMQDIGGVRAVVGSIEEIRRVQRRLTRVRPVRGYSDYITSPREISFSLHALAAELWLRAFPNPPEFAHEAVDSTSTARRAAAEEPAG